MCLPSRSKAPSGPRRRSPLRGAPKSFRAAVMLFLAGGADTWNLLVPLNCQLYEEYGGIPGSRRLGIRRAARYPDRRVARHSASTTRCRTSRVWGVFHEVRLMVGCRSLPLSLSPSLRWVRWNRHVAPVLGCGSWGRLWGKDAATIIDATVQRMLGVMMNLCRPDGEGWLNWHMRPTIATRLCLTGREGCPRSHKLPGQCAQVWKRWCRRSEDTWVRRLFAWRSGAHEGFLRGLSDAAGPSTAHGGRTGWADRR